MAWVKNQSHVVPSLCSGRAASAGCGGLVCSDPVMGCETWDCGDCTLSWAETWHHAVNSDTTRRFSIFSFREISVTIYWCVGAVWVTPDTIIYSRQQQRQRVYDLSDVNKYLGHCWGRNEEEDDMQDCQVIGVITSPCVLCAACVHCPLWLWSPPCEYWFLMTQMMVH